MVRLGVVRSSGLWYGMARCGEARLIRLKSFLRRGLVRSGQVGSGRVSQGKDLVKGI